MEFVGAALPLAQADLAPAARALGCPLAAVTAVMEVETSGSGFLPDKRPKILFEAHVFHRLTGGRFDNAAPDLSSPHWNRSLYGASGAHQYDRLAAAMRLDCEAALMSASWGAFQIMGENFRLAGFAAIDAFVAAMCESEGQHLAAFVGFCRSQNLAAPLARLDWAAFARGYNGPGAVEQYARRLRAAYAIRAARAGRSLRQGDRGESVRLLQQRLGRRGYPVAPDGDFGPLTERAVEDFQSNAGLTIDGIAGPATLQALAQP